MIYTFALYFKSQTNKQKQMFLKAFSHSLVLEDDWLHHETVPTVLGSHRNHHLVTYTYHTRSGRKQLPKWALWPVI